MTWDQWKEFADRHILQTMAELGYPPDSRGEPSIYFGIGHFTNDWLSRDMVSALLKDLTRRGLCRYRRGLFDDDGMVAGAGYGITRAGWQEYNNMIIRHNELARTK